MFDNVKGFHIETTNVCTLKCPRCPRTEFLDTFGTKNWSNKHLNLEHFKNFLDIDITNITFNLCGNNGDPIYYTDLVPMVAWLKSKNAQVNIITNGSYRTVKWWNELSALLTSDDIVTFSIDGLPENFTKYRINADWKTIEQGIAVMAQSTTQLIWKYIPFAFNEHNIEQAKLLSEQLGFDKFLISLSDRWQENDEYRPKNFVGQRETSIMHWYGNRNSMISPDCKNNNNEHFITADGFYTPCCYSADYRWYYKSEFYKQQENYDISKNTFSEILNRSKEFFDTIETTKPQYCTFNCPKI